MKLVGATGGFIRRPFIRTGIVNGVMAGIVACILLALVIVAVHRASPQVALFVSWPAVALLFPSMILLGVVICGISAALATNKYLKLDYDDMF